MNYVLPIGGRILSERSVNRYIRRSQAYLFYLYRTRNTLGATRVSFCILGIFADSSSLITSEKNYLSVSLSTDTYRIPKQEILVVGFLAIEFAFGGR